MPDFDVELQEGSTSLERARALPKVGRRPQERLPIWLGGLDDSIAHYFARAVRAYFDAVPAIRRAHGDATGIARALSDLRWIAWRQCDFAKARPLSNECLALAEEVGATRVAALALTNLGATALCEGDFHEACEACEDSHDRRDCLSS